MNFKVNYFGVFYAKFSHFVQKDLKHLTKKHWKKRWPYMKQTPVKTFHPLTAKRLNLNTASSRITSILFLSKAVTECCFAVFWIEFGWLPVKVKTSFQHCIHSWNCNGKIRQRLKVYIFSCALFSFRYFLISETLRLIYVFTIFFVINIFMFPVIDRANHRVLGLVGSEHIILPHNRTWVAHTAEV